MSDNRVSRAFQWAFSGQDHKIAVLDSHGSATYSELREDLERLTRLCESNGVGPQHRIAALLPDTAGTATVLTALSGICQIAPFNPALNERELSRFLDNWEPHALLTAGPKFPSIDIPLIEVSLQSDGRPTHVSLRFPQPLGVAGSAAMPTGLVLLTSGTTGQPKRVLLSPEQLLQSARNIAGTLSLCETDTALNCLPTFHVGGIVDLFLAPLVSGGRVAFEPQRSPRPIAAAVARHEVTWLQLVPTILHRFLEDLDAETLLGLGHRLRFVRTVSSDLAPALQTDAERRFGTAFVQMYGMTETAGQITSNAPPPGERRTGSIGRSAGPEVAVLDRSGAPLPIGSIGEVCVRGTTVMSGYQGAYKGNFFGSWFRTGDLGSFDDDGFLYLSGREKEMINRGGEKISPIEIEQLVLGLPSVSEAVAFAEPHQTLGEQVGLAVVPRQGAKADEAQILNLLRGELAEFKLPRRVRFVSQIPRLGSGKIDRSGLARQFSAQEELVLDGVSEKLAAVWQKHLKSKLHSLDDDFFDAGGDSLLAIEFMAEVERVLGREIDPNALYEAPRFGEFVNRVQQTNAPRDDDPILKFVRRQMAGWPGQRLGLRELIIGVGAAGDRNPLFFCSQGEHPALKGALHPDRPLYAMRSLRKYRGKTPAMNRHLAEVYATEIERVRPEGPLLLGGFCEGAKILAMAADRLRRNGRDIRVFLSIDSEFERPTGFPVLNVWTESEHNSMARIYAMPERGFSYLHPAGAEAIRIAGNHGAAMRTENLKGVGRAFEEIAEGKATLQTAQNGGVTIQEVSADIRLKLPRLFPRTRLASATVTLRNSGNSAWAATADGGPEVCIDFFNFDKHCRIRRAGTAPIDTPIQPGETVRVTVPVSYPPIGLPQIAVATLSDDGIRRFGGRNGKGTGKLVWLRPV